jgi:hypothetical protein
MAMTVLAEVLAGTHRGPAFLPWVWELAAERAGLDVTAMTASATTLVAALQSAAELVESDAITVLVAAPDGAPLEALRRLAATVADDRPGRRELVAVIPGPAALAARDGHTDPDDRDEAAEDLARAVLEARPGVLAVDEPEPDPDTTTCYRTIARLADYYGARTLVITPPDRAQFLTGAGIDAIVDPAATTNTAAEGLVTSSWAPRPGGADADALRARSRQVRAAREEVTSPCP